MQAMVCLVFLPQLTMYLENTVAELCRNLNPHGRGIGPTLIQVESNRAVLVDRNVLWCGIFSH